MNSGAPWLSTPSAWPWACILSSGGLSQGGVYHKPQANNCGEEGELDVALVEGRRPGVRWGQFLSTSLGAGILVAVLIAGGDFVFAQLGSPLAQQLTLINSSLSPRLCRGPFRASFMAFCEMADRRKASFPTWGKEN